MFDAFGVSTDEAALGKIGAPPSSSAPLPLVLGLWPGVDALTSQTVRMAATIDATTSTITKDPG